MAEVIESIQNGKKVAGKPKKKVNKMSDAASHNAYGKAFKKAQRQRKVRAKLKNR